MQKAKVCPTVYFVRGRTETMHPDVPYPEQGWHGLVCTFANMFVQSMDVNRLHQTLAGLDLIVVVDHQMTETVRWADVVLPATTWYEKTDLTATPLHPFLQLQQAAIDPVGEFTLELWMWREIVRRVAPDLATEWFELDEEDAIELILAAGDHPGRPSEGITLADLKAGPVRLRCPTRRQRSSSRYTIASRSHQCRCLRPLEKMASFVPTRRIELLEEEDRFIELGETVPTSKPPFRRRGP